MQRPRGGAPATAQLRPSQHQPKDVRTAAPAERIQAFGALQPPLLTDTLEQGRAVPARPAGS